jgi:hypothetical protein
MTLNLYFTKINLTKRNSFQTSVQLLKKTTTISFISFHVKITLFTLEMVDAMIRQTLNGYEHGQ